MAQSRTDRRSPAREIAGVFVVVMLLALGVRGAVGAPGKEKEQRKPAAPAPAVTRLIGAVQMSIDPATGKVRPPTVEEAAQLARELQLMLRRSPEDLTVTPLPNGALMVNLQDTFQEVAMATVGADGKVTLHCVDDAAKAMALLNGSGPGSGAGTGTGTGTVTVPGPGVAARKKYAAGAAEKE